MRKMTKKLGAVVLALAMCFSLFATALAASSTDTSFSITISNSVSGNTYNAYKIFDVTYDDNGNYSYTVSSVSNWYSLFTSEDNAELGGYEMPFVFTATTGTNGDNSTTYIVSVKTDSNGDAAYTDDQIIGYLQAAIAKIAYDENDGWNSTTLEDYGYAGSATGNGGTVTIDVTNSGPGYYFVTTTTGSIVSITTTDPNATIIDKQTPPPDIKKVMVHGEGDDQTSDSAEADGMGEDVTFDVTATAPITEDDNYVLDYTITDSMTNGLLIELTEDQFNYDSSTGKYTLKDDVINEWITLTDGAGNVKTPFTDYVYDYSFELVGYDVYTDETTGDTVHTFSGFVLTYYTYNVDQYKTDLYTALSAAYPDSITSMWPDYPDSWPSNVPADFDFDSESYFEAYSAESNAVGTVYPANATVEIKYTAHVSSLEGYENTNTIYMDHDVTPFNHPTPWSPTPGPQKFAKDYVYSWELQIQKITADGEETPLEGATFTLESNNMKDVKVGHSYLYVPLSGFVNGEYTYGDETYKLVDFESTYYVATAWDDNDNPTAWAVGEGNSDNDTYVRILTSDVEVEDTTSTSFTATGTTDENGMLYFEGLGEGVYTLTEIKAPDGYNLLEDPIIFRIDFYETHETIEGEDVYVGHFTVTYGTIDEDGNFVPNEGDNGTELTDCYILQESIENSTGTELPGTGGIGTTIFYIIGGVLVVGAVVVLVTRRRMTREG